MGFLTTFLHETITGNRIVKAFNMEEYEKRRFAEENDRLFKTFLKRIRIRALSHPLWNYWEESAVAVIIWVGGYMVIRGELTSGDLFFIHDSYFHALSPIRELSKVNLEIQEGLAAATSSF